MLSRRVSRVLKPPSTPSWLILVCSSHSSTTTFTLDTPLSPSTIQNDPTRCVSPLMRDLGPISRPNLTSEARSPFTSPSPFQRDVGGLFSFDGGFGEGEPQGGPRKWEAHEVRPENEPQPLLWFVSAATTSPTAAVAMTMTAAAPAAATTAVAAIAMMTMTAAAAVAMMTTTAAAAVVTTMTSESPKMKTRAR